MEKALHGAFARLGATRLDLEKLTIRNDAKLFVPVSRLNQLRRELVADLEKALDAGLETRIQENQDAIKVGPASRSGPDGSFRWSLKVDRLEFLESLESEDLTNVDEIIIDIARDHPALDKVEQWGNRIGRERIRLALPALTRSWEDKGIRHKIEQLRAAGWRKWEVANLSGWHYLGIEPSQPGAYAPGSPDIDLTTDWSVYVLNRLAAQQLMNMGVSRFALSPEDGLANWRALLQEFGPRAILIVYQDTPLFIAESCAYANLIGGCPGKANCTFESMDMTSSHGEKVTALDYHCRTIVLNQGPFCLSDRLEELKEAGAISVRADFIYRKYLPDQVRNLWRQVRAGQLISGAQAANYERGIL
jgi:putative protease